MKIIQFLPTLESGGVEQGVLEISKALVQANHQSHVVSAGGRLVNDLINDGAQHHVWPLHKKNLLTFRYISVLRKWLISMKPDIVHVRSRMPAWIVWRAVQGMPEKNKPKLISTIHGLYSVNFYSAVMTKPENIIVVSQSAKDYVINNYKNTSTKNIKLIFRGVDNKDFYHGYKADDEWLSDWYDQYPETKSSKLLTIAGRITPLKDFEKIILLAKDLKKAEHNIKVLIAGEVKDRHQKYLSQLKSMIKSNNLEKDILFLNYRKDIKNIYSISSIVFNTSNKPESFGRSILEPLALGIPSIGYSRGGVKEILDELYPFGLVEAGNTEMMYNKSVSILNGENQDIKENSKFLKSKMCNETLKFYEEVIS